MMKEWNECMSCTKDEYDELSELVKNINQHLGIEVFELENTPDYELECVDIIQGGTATFTYTSFEDASFYLRGVENGVLLKEEYSV